MRPLGSPLRHVAEIEPLDTCDRFRRAVAAGEQQEVIDELLQPDDFLEHTPMSRLRVGRRRVLEIDLQLRAHPRQRAAELV